MQIKLRNILSQLCAVFLISEVLFEFQTRRIESMEGVNSHKREELSSVPTKTPHAEEAETPATEATTPAKEATTPATEATTPVKEATTPAKEATTPAKEATTPAKEATTEG